MAAPQEETDFSVHPVRSRECEWKDGRRELDPQPPRRPLTEAFSWKGRGASSNQKNEAST